MGEGGGLAVVVEGGDDGLDVRLGPDVAAELVEVGVNPVVLVHHLL
jgi:prolyl-tRNA editing enzyme YbaK/EbsC (Cys-tRNA(Pro) deacylase)